MVMNSNILDFYKKTSRFTDLGFYRDFVLKLPNNVKDLCLLQRMQTIHPADLRNKNIRNSIDKVYGDMTKVLVTRLDYEEDYFPTAQSMIAELLRRNASYDKNRDIRDKIHITCRGQTLLLTSILKAKGIPARARSGFAPYIYCDGVNYDHWITEYYNKLEDRWILVDADECLSDLKFNPYDIPKSNFIFGAEAYLGIRNKKYKKEQLYYASDPATLGLKAAVRALFYDFHALMNNEIIFLHQPKYIMDMDFELDEVQYQELDNLALLLLEPDKNFEKLRDIWDNNLKFRILSGALN